MDHNPFLAARRHSMPDAPANGEIERPGESVNLAWQTRAAPPTDYENRLGDALERVFADGAGTLEEVVAGLNSANCPTPSGAPWDAATFESEIRRLGA
jgi:hypothetical protein